MGFIGLQSDLAKYPILWGNKNLLRKHAKKHGLPSGIIKNEKELEVLLDEIIQIGEKIYDT